LVFLRGNAWVSYVLMFSPWWQSSLQFRRIPIPFSGRKLTISTKIFGINSYFIHPIANGLFLHRSRPFLVEYFNSLTNLIILSTCIGVIIWCWFTKIK
jgi:hypothetical protein